MAVVRGSEYKEFELMGNHMLGLATRGRGALEVAVWRSRTDPGATTPPHYYDHEEVIVILSGSGKAKI
jgi:quercetin dioxygenase-like cupin family protein